MSSESYLGEYTGALRHRCGLAKVRRKPRYRVTAVAHYVAQRQNRVARALRAVFAEWSHRWAKVIRTTAERLDLGKAADPSEQILLDVLDSLGVSEFSQDVADELLPEMRKAFRKAGVKSAGKVMGHAPKDLVNQLDKLALRYAQRRAAELVGEAGGAWSITEATRKNLRATIATGVREGQSPAELSAAIEESFAFSESRADTIARTELAMSHVQGNVEGWRQTGEVDRKRSILGDLHAEEDECDENAEAGVVEMDEEFPSGDAFPPYHPNCVCDVLPVLTGEDE